MKNFNRPISKKLLLKLLHCRKLELEGKLCGIREFKHSLSTLYRSGYVEFKKVLIEGKEMIVVFVTAAGLQCLDYLPHK
jgi:hypothetical protein